MFTLITGASSGIGYELAKVFARHGHNLILTARSKDTLEKIASEIKTHSNITVEIISLDLSKEGSASLLHNQILEKNWNVDILVNNAGIGDHGSFSNSTLKRQLEMIQLNITSLTELTHLFLPQMILRKNGRVLNVASTASFQPGPYMSVYYATKAYVLSFSEALSEELIDSGVTITTLCPGPTLSGFQKAANISNISLLKVMNLPTSKEVAEYAYKAMIKNQIIAIHGIQNQILVHASRFFPRSIVRKIVKKLQVGR